MAADQRKKPATTVRIAATCHDQGRLKKKNLGLIPCPRSNTISLEWDGKNKCVVAKKDQIGLSQRHLVSFGSYVYHYPNVLADVLTLPKQVFELDIAKEVFSFEVWQTLLSENERNYLMQFLPEGVDMHKVVQELLLGHSNFHFGNPFLKWSSSLCSGNLHPDAIMHQERCIRASKKTYYTDLAKYHNGMINSLLMWKERWATSKHLEDKVLQEMWRSRKQAGNMSSDENEHKIYKVKEDLAGTSESGSSIAEENSVSSDNENLATQGRDLQKGKVTLEDRFNNSAAGLKVLERSKKGERMHKENIQSIDGSRYMSYIKVSRKQHQRVKSSMKHSSNSIQSRSLNRVLGDLYSFHVQPFELFEEEERKKLHAHWLQLAIKDVPAAFANFRRFQLAKSQLPHYWKQEMREKLVSLNEAHNDEEKDKPHIVSPALVDTGASSKEAADAMEIEEKEPSDCLLEECSDDRVENHKLIILSGVVMKVNVDSIMEDPEVMNHDEKGSVEPASKHESQFASAFMQKQHLPKITELIRGDRSCPIEENNNNYYVTRERVDSQVNDASETLRKVGANAVSQHSALSSTSSNVWPLVSTRNPLHYSTSNCIIGYPEEQESRYNNDKEVMGNNMWHKQSVDGSFLSPYAGADRGILGQNESLHHHYLKAQNTSLYYNDEQFGLQASSSVEYPGRLGEQLNMPMPLRDVMRENEGELDNVIQERMFSAERFPPMQQHLSSLSVKSSIQQAHWAASNNPTIQNALPFQSRLSLGPSNNRFGWSNLDSSSSADAGFSNIVDESLYGGVDPSHFNDDNNNNHTLELPYAGRGHQLIGSGFGYGGSLVPSATSNNVLHSDLLSGQLATSSSSSSAPALPLVYNNNSVVVGPTQGGRRWNNIPSNQNFATQEEPFPRPRNS